MRSRPATDVICDAGPLIHLDELGCLDLLGDFHAVLAPDQVWREVELHRPKALRHADLALRRVPVSVSQDAFLALVESTNVGLGEQAALSLMTHHPEGIFLTDDAAARLAAGALGYRAHGSIGILVRAIRRQLRTPDEVISILGELPLRSSLHIRPQLLEEIIAGLQEARSEGTAW